MAAALLPGCSRNWPPWHGHSELGAAALLKAVWRDLRLASLLTHLFAFKKNSVRLLYERYLCLRLYVLHSRRAVEDGIV